MTKSMPADRMKAIEDRMNHITPGPYIYQPRKGGREITLKRTHWEVAAAHDFKGVAYVFGDSSDNADFIAHAPEDIAWLLARLKEAEGLLTDARGTLDMEGLDSEDSDSLFMRITQFLSQRTREAPHA